MIAAWEAVTVPPPDVCCAAATVLPGPNWVVVPLALAGLITWVLWMLHRADRDTTPVQPVTQAGDRPVREAPRRVNDPVQTAAAVLARHGSGCTLCGRSIDTDLPVDHSMSLRVIQVHSLILAGLPRLDTLRPAHRVCVHGLDESPLSALDAELEDYVNDRPFDQERDQ